MSALVLDTHTVLWALLDRPRLSRAALHALQLAAKEAATVFVPTICIVEITYLIEKRRVQAGALDDLAAQLFNPLTNLTEAPLDGRVAARVASIDRRQVPDLPDRVIAATAAKFGLPLVTADRRIRASNVTTIW